MSNIRYQKHMPKNKWGILNDPYECIAFYHMNISNFQLKFSMEMW